MYPGSKRLQAAFVAGCGLLLMLWVSRAILAQIPTVPKAAPTYPQRLNESHSVESPRGWYHTVRLTTFDTTDSPEAVYRFYQDRLTRFGPLGWQQSVLERDRVKIADAYFGRGCGPYAEIRATRTPDGLTHVLVREADGVCL